ncbi:MAG: hypothetical protein JXN64_10920 [Spirochaetes bacterium]|nr:hypothetical protein [Spirochaetota bacterium]
MKKIMLKYVMLFIFGFFAFSSDLYAIGLGGYITGAGGSYDWTYSMREYDETEITVDSNVFKLGGGFILDTAVAKDTLFNYRLNVGYTALVIDNEEGVYDIYGWDFHVYNTFGFGLVRTESIRFWIGPQAGLGLYYGEWDVSEDTYDTNSFSTFFLSIGGAIGLNYNISSRFSLGFDGGIRFASHSGYGELGDQTYDITGSGAEFFANVCFIVRINDSYSPVVIEENPVNTNPNINLNYNDRIDI